MEVLGSLRLRKAERVKGVLSVHLPHVSAENVLPSVCCRMNHSWSYELHGVYFIMIMVIFNEYSDIFDK
jgi:hypothetical protein